MKNDFDFIKDKIENSGVKAPDDMGEQFVMDALADSQPKVVSINSKRRRTSIAVSSIAAVLVVAIAVGVALKISSDRNRIPTDPDTGKIEVQTVPDESGLIRYKDRDEVKAAVKSVIDERYNSYSKDYDSAIAEEYSAAADGGSYRSDSAIGRSGASGSATGGSGDDSSSFSETYKQVEGVDEADIIKTDGKYIYCAEGYGDEISVFTAKGEDSQKVAVIHISDSVESSDDEDAPFYTNYLSEFYLCGDRLVAMCGYYGDTDETRARVYDISDKNDITLLDTMTQSGSYISSRMIGDTLYTVSSYYIYDEEDDLPRCGNTSTPDEIPADCICAMSRPTDTGFLIVSAYDTKDFEASTESKAVFGGATDIYCSLSNMYVYTTAWDNGSSDVIYESSFYTDRSNVSTKILKIDLTDGPDFSAVGEVSGYVDSQYSLDESDGNLRVATTSYENGRDTNNLFVLDEELNIIGSVTGFAKNESIKAVRYVGDTAYVITYEQTDPLFVIDLSSPTSPEILGEVKISGFSTMLVPVDENTVLGLGYHTEDEDYIDMEVQEGFKLALFDVSDKSNPKVLDSVSFVDYYSEVQYDPKALVYNPDRGDYIIPLNYAHYGHDDYYYYDDEDYDPDDVSEFCGGMLNFRVEDGKIVVTDKYRSGKTENTERCIFIDDTIYMTYRYFGNIALETTSYK